MADVAAPPQEGNLKGTAPPYLEKQRPSKGRFDPSNPDQQVAKSEEKFKIKVRHDLQSKFRVDEKQHYGNAAQSFSKQERKKNRAAYGLNKNPQITGSNSSQAENIKSINKVSSLASFPQRAPSIPD